MAFYDLLLVF